MFFSGLFSSRYRSPENTSIKNMDVPFSSLETTGAFMDSAAVIKTLDLVVTADTAIAHLAGGLGVPVWVALPHVSDWRWLIGRNDSPWYPTMRLFRQGAPGQWEQVFAQMATELEAILCDQSRANQFGIA